MQAPLPWLDKDTFGFPDPATAMAVPNGLLAAGGDLRPERLLRAYQLGVFPWFDASQPPLWWTPDPRMVLFPEELHVSRSMLKFLNISTLTLTTDSDFPGVVAACAEPRRGAGGTWITPGMQTAYQQLFELGYAHSVEVRAGARLVGGLYGIALGQVFFGESMFSRISNASKLAFIYLVRGLAAGGYRLIDCQVANPHLESLGARNISRREFMRYLPGESQVPKPPHWPLQ
ncbi:MAG: leucyl/phenylalanyl-tRNA--protein transferase [Burkholderiales bacterium]